METPTLPGVPITIPLIKPHPKETYSYRVRAGLKFEFSGRMDEPEIILNSNTRGKSGVTLGLGELCQLAGFVGLSGYAQYINPNTVRQLRPIRYRRPEWSGDKGEWTRRDAAYTPESLYQYYSHDERPGYTRVDIEKDGWEEKRSNKIIVRNKWGTNPSDKVVLWPEDLQALIPFIVANVLDSEYSPTSERDYLDLLGIPIATAKEHSARQCARIVARRQATSV